jgi:hypothetical protein
MMEEEEGAIMELPLDDYMGYMLALELHPRWLAGTCNISSSLIFQDFLFQFVL